MVAGPGERGGGGAVRCNESGGVVSWNRGALEEWNHVMVGSSAGLAMVLLGIRALARESTEGVERVRERLRGGLDSSKSRR